MYVATVEKRGSERREGGREARRVKEVEEEGSEREERREEEVKK